jgi:hypothetical protein
MEVEAHSSLPLTDDIFAQTVMDLSLTEGCEAGEGPLNEGIYAAQTKTNLSLTADGCEALDSPLTDGTVAQTATNLRPMAAKSVTAL